MIQPTVDLKYLGKKKEFWKVPKSKTWICPDSTTIYTEFILYL